MGSDDDADRQRVVAIVSPAADWAGYGVEVQDCVDARIQSGRDPVVAVDMDI